MPVKDKLKQKTSINVFKKHCYIKKGAFEFVILKTFFAKTFLSQGLFSYFQDSTGL